MMKKLIAVLLLVCLLPLCAAAETDEDDNVIIALDGAEIFFTPIQGAHVLTRESSAAEFRRVGLLKTSVLPYMEETGSYALLFLPDAEHGVTEIHICAAWAEAPDFDDLAVYGLEMYLETAENIYISDGFDVEAVELCHTYSGHSYARIEASRVDANGAVEYQMAFFTCQSGYEVGVLFFPYEGRPSEEQIFLYEGLVDSLWVSESSSAAADE